MPLTLVGCGLGSADGLTVAGKRAIEEADDVYLECYTSVLCPDLSLQAMGELFGRADIREADRTFVEQECDGMIAAAKHNKKVAFCVIGDALYATTHTDLILRAHKAGVTVRVIHNASIMTAIASTGLQMYRFGEAVSIPYWQNNWRPTSWLAKIRANYERNLHTVLLLDIQVKERTPENIMKDNKIFEPPRFMSCAEALQQLREALKIEKEEMEVEPFVGDDAPVVGCARLGREDQKIAVGTLGNLQDMGKPLHAMVLPAAELHELEEEMLHMWREKEG